MPDQVPEELEAPAADAVAAPEPDAAEPAGPAPAEGEAGGAPAVDEGVVRLREILEALVFVHRGILPPKTVQEVLGEEFSEEELAAGFAALRDEYARRGGAIALVEVAGGWQLVSRPDLAPWIQKLDFYENHRHLSRPTLETLAIIAYKQPVTRAEIEAIRGVNAERIVRNLLEKKLIRILGHKDVPGRPMVLGTTKDFLQLFGINSLADLPPLKEFVEQPAAEEIEEMAVERDAGQGGEVGDDAGSEGTGTDGAAGDGDAEAAGPAEAGEAGESGESGEEAVRGAGEGSGDAADSGPGEEPGDTVDIGPGEVAGEEPDAAPGGEAPDGDRSGEA